LQRCENKKEITTTQKREKKVGMFETTTTKVRVGGKNRLLSKTTPHGRLDTTLVDTTEDTEVTLLTPVLVPGVGDEPVLGAVVNTVAKDADSVTTLIRARDVLVDTAGVGHEILIDREGTLARTVGGDLGHHISLTANGVDLGSLALVGLELDARIIDALGLARRSGDDLAGAGVLAAGDVVIAARKRVLDALLSDNTSALPVVVGARRITTIARASTRAAVHILSRKDDILTVLDALTIRHSLDGTESPAGAAIALITDHAHGLAVGPLGTRIELLRSVGAGNLRVGAKRGVLRIGPGELLVSTKEGADLLVGEESGGALKGGGPEVLDAVDVLDSLTSSNGRHACGSSKKSNDKLHPNR